MAEIVISVASKVAEYLVAPVGRQCGYVISTDRYVGQLREELEKLDDVIAVVQRSVDHADNNMWEIKTDVNRWKKNAETIANEARSLLDNDGRAKETCCCGWLPDPEERYCLGRDASKKVQAIQLLIPQGKFERVYYESAPPGLVGGASEVNSSASDGGDTIQELIARGQFEKVDFENPPTVLVGGASGVNSSAGDGGDFITSSRASIFQDIMKALDDEKLRVIGVYGPGGVGKTTLLEEVQKKLGEARRPFRMIVKVRVSQIPDSNNIVDQIADAFGLELKDKQSPQGKADALSKRLKSNPDEKVLIIFDNLWVKLDLEVVGIPWGDVSSKCKLLLTSRFKNVVEQEMGADQTFLLQGLTDGEAFKLFENKVGDKLKDNEELKSIADQVVKKLAGLPLLIISVAITLKSSDESAWRNMLIDLDDSNKEKRETIVRLSYDHLKSEDTKYLFLLCGLIGGTIRVELLFVLAMGLGFFERFNKTIQDSRDRLNNMLNELRSACLLLDGGNDKGNVTIHDLYSEVVISVPFRGHNFLMMNNNCDSWPKEKLKKCWAICLTGVGKDRLAEIMTCWFHDLKILMLSRPENWYRKPGRRHDVGDYSGLLDFTYMRELRVLYLCSMHIITLPSSIEILGNLWSLYLDHCDVGDVAVLGKLKALQILSFVGSKISKLPKEIGELTNLRSLNLSNCKDLQIIESGVLKSLIKLEELHMKESFDRWTGKDEIPSEFCNAALAELKSLRKIASLEISIPNPTILLEDADLPFENLIKFWINIGNVEGREFKGLRTMKLKLEGNSSTLSKEWVQKTLHKTQYLHLDGFGEFKKNAHELCIRGFPQLKHLDILNTSSIKYIASSSNDPFLTPFTILESLFLENIINMEKICNGPVAPDYLSKLKALSIKKCHRLENLWFMSEMQRLEQLEEIHVCECDSLKAIITNDAGKVEVAADDIVELPNLNLLELLSLPNMTGFCSGAEGAPIQAGVVDEGGGDEGTELVTTTSDLQNTYSNSFFDRKASLPNLEKLKLNSVGSFKWIWHDELSRSSFCKLATITVENCYDLLHIFPSTIIGRLHKLKSVEVLNCPSLKSLFDFGSLDSNTEQNTVLLPKLVSINIKGCSSLESLFNCGSLDSNAEHKIILLPKLEEVNVSGAEKLRHMVMSHPQMVLNFPSLGSVCVEDCSNLSYLFPKYTATSLMKLKSLTICNCEQIKEVILKKEASRLEAKVISFPCLSWLKLKELDNFGAFIPSPTSVKRQLGEMAEENDESSQLLFNEMVTFPNITSLEIKGLRCKELWNDQIPTNSFQKLEYLKLKNCDNLQHIATSYMWKKLQCCLKILEVTSCHSIEIIYEGDGTDIESGKLRRLLLHNLKNLRCIWQSDSLPNIPFPNLRYTKAVRCSHLEILFPTFTAKFLEQIEELMVESCEDMKLIAGHEKWEEASGTTITFSNLAALRLFKLPKFKSFLLEKYSLKFSCSKDFPSLRFLSMESCGAEPDQVLGDWHGREEKRILRSLYYNTSDTE